MSKQQAKIEKTIARQKEKVEEGQFYEAHQQLRVIASRYVKSSDWAAATNLLSSGALLLLNAGQGGSGGDLCMFLMDVYNKGETKVDASSRDRLLSLLRAFPAHEPTKKRFVGEIMGWSSKFGEFPAGDPELHHVAGTIFAEEGEAYEAEKHLILGTKDSPETLARLEYTWYTSDSAHTAPHYIARAVLPYLLTGNIRAASKSLLLFTSRLSQSHPSLATQEVNSKTSDLRVFPSLPLMNFLGLLVLAVGRGGADLFRQLKTHYKDHLKELDGAWDEALAQIGETYFGIRIPSQSNPLFDMMSNFMLGGALGGGKKSAPKPGSSTTPAPAPGLD